MATSPVRTLTEDLHGFEAVATKGLTAWNRTRLTKWWVSRYVHHISHRWIQVAIGNRLRVKGGEPLRKLHPNRGLLLMGNHRTFWDMYVATSVLTAYRPQVRDLYFPVRKRFFYTHPVGVLLNLAVSGGSMWPPMATGFDRRKRDLVALKALARALDAPNSLVGIHPEGTRNRSEDPLDLLPPKGGAGRLVHDVHPDTMVVTFFLCGLTDDLVTEIRRNFRASDQRGPPIDIAFGEPVRAGDLDRTGPPLQTARALLTQIQDLGRSLRDPA